MGSMWLLTSAHGAGVSLAGASRSLSTATVAPWRWRHRRSITVIHRRLSVSANEDADTASPADAETTDQTFLTIEEAGLIELSTLDMHERFLCRLTVSSLNLLRVISKQEGMPIEQLNAGIICDWFQKDKAKRENDFNSATLKW